MFLCRLSRSLRVRREALAATPLSLKRRDFEHALSLSSPSDFWLHNAQRLDWHSFPRTGLVSESWFSDGKVNMAYNCVDRHVLSGNANRTAIIHESPIINASQKVTTKTTLPTKYNI
jgi:hypothetical protein